MTKALVTGIAGFAGSHLAEHLIESGIKVYGLYHKDHATKNIEHIKNRLELIASNLSSKKELRIQLEKIKPKYIFHLAAFAPTAQSFNNPQKTIENNLFSQLNLLEAIKSLSLSSKILIVGSSEEYGAVNKNQLPINEETPLKPTSPYSLSKLFQDYLGLQYFISHKLNIIRVRPFNHIGPRQNTNFVVPDFASQIALIEKKMGGTIKVGNLSASRDFTDVRDMVKAYLLALQKGKSGEVYNIGSGKGHKISDILNTLISFSKPKIKVEIDKSLFRPVDVKEIYCDYSKFGKLTGWKPDIDINKSLLDTLNYQRSINLNE